MRPAVVITGISGNLGRALARVLHTQERIIGVASGLLNLIPFAGIILAAAVPLLAATLQYSTPGPFLTIAGTVVALHLVEDGNALFVVQF